jgi:hypothetical protein
MFESHDDSETLPSSLAAALRRDVRPAGGREAAVGAIMSAVRAAPAPRRAGSLRSRLLTLRPMKPRWALRRGALSPAGAMLAACLTLAVGWLGALGGQHASPARARGEVGTLPTGRKSAGALRDSILDNALVVAVRDTLRMVRFAFEAPAASRVALIGDWGGAAVPLRRVAGAWTADVPLPAGRHRFGFVVDDTGWVGRGRPAAQRATVDTGFAATRLVGDTI